MLPASRLVKKNLDFFRGYRQGGTPLAPLGGQAGTPGTPLGRHPRHPLEGQGGRGGGGAAAVWIAWIEARTKKPTHAVRIATALNVVSSVVLLACYLTP